MKTTATNRKVRTLLTAIKAGTLLPRPEFQRRLVWANKHKVAFLDTVLHGYPFPEIYLASGEVNTDTGEGTEMLVDGQQRITTLYQYFTSSSELKLPKEFRSYSDLETEAKLAYLEYDVVVRDLGKLSLIEIKEVFQRINSTNYALNAMEISNARFEGELKTFGDEMSQQTFFEDHGIFSPSEVRRMHDLRFVLTVIITLMSGYFNRDDELSGYLKMYNDEFDEAESISKRIHAAIELVEKCDFPAKSRVWKKSDLFTIIIEVDRKLFREKTELRAGTVRGNLVPFYDLVDNISSLESPDLLLSSYHKASLQATNDRVSRTRRGEVISYVLSQAEEVDWEEWSSRATETAVSQILDWFYQNYEDPANGVPYESAEGGYQYILGGPYNPRDVVTEQFEDLPEIVVEKAIERITASGWDWIRIGQY